MATETAAWRQDLAETVADILIVDTHEHIPDETVACADTLGFFGLFEHYVSSDLVSAGMPRASLEAMRTPGNGLSDLERWTLMEPWWPHVRNTGYGAAMREYLSDLFGVAEISRDTVEDLCGRMRAARKPGWFHTVLREKARIDKALVIRWPGQPVTVDRDLFRAVPILDHYAMPSTRAELEALEKESGLAIQTLDRLMAAQEAMLDRFTAEGIAGVKIFAAYRRSLQFDRWSKAEAARAFDRVWLSQALDLTFADLKPLQDFMTRRVVALAAERGLPVQIHTGLQEGNGNHLANANPLLLTDLVMDHPDTRFDLFHAGYPYAGEMAAMAKYFPNVYADLCWVQAISPSAAARILDEWLDTVPSNKILAVGGDSNYAEGAYGHCNIARRIACNVLADRVERGMNDAAEAKRLARRILRENALELFRL
ncbi:MAG: amidohydrolase family protein [Candidatus Hydrogenedentes bacterium]|nr:amidohydrolase family protein [Candidatus Hydrogenedentota bacterium]